ncbi:MULTISPECIES: phospho-sugar mutase [unclassified Microbacterium]|uniref:phospho-sugar mutase n=1 Tax=unclassified Microbacterium TaxID=2609290 RepID=UPI000EA83A65|nr:MULTISPECIES: phospho-sugar mutase [unclassified Microbacterium]MBT2486777.1 phospho-sugar mutase [Microbacterium sp. ISL-108]RKN64705.1 phospho-sugar mutase [Microbacterium sp. CGR2]
MNDERLAQARAWLRQDPDAQTRDELAGVITRASAGDEAAIADLDDRFRARLAFGTAGLRGELGAGSNRMNRVLVAQAAAGFAAYLRGRSPGTTPTVVVGYDGRRNSRVFAADSAELFAGAGLRAILLPRLLPTPVLAFAVRHLGADAGVMVTASHNPPNDNGYKVYLGGADLGSQIVAPADAEIAAHIQRVADAGDVSILPRSTAYETAGEEVVEAYIAATAAVAPAPTHAQDLRWVYTAMHGVGGETLSRILTRAGYPQPSVVAEQAAPDPTFRTVSFPNPEEPGAMDLAFALGRKTEADFILANDPDADRLAVAIPDASAPGGWRRLTGNEVGLLLGARAARAAAGTPGASLACSLVSSPGLAAVAAHHGLDFHETLTGFKWISRAPGIVFGFEEALGYLVNPETVRDKDGISAAVAVLGLAAEARDRGATLGDLLQELGDTYGHFASGQVSVRVDDLAVIGSVMLALRTLPPAQIAGRSIAASDDLLQAPPGQPSGDVLRYRLTDGSRVIVRPSGTEPKLKVYIDARAESAERARAAVAELESGVRTLLDERS